MTAKLGSFDPASRLGFPAPICWDLGMFIPNRLGFWRFCPASFNSGPVRTVHRPDAAECFGVVGCFSMGYSHQVDVVFAWKFPQKIVPGPSARLCRVAVRTKKNDIKLWLSTKCEPRFRTRNMIDGQWADDHITLFW